MAVDILRVAYWPDPGFRMGREGPKETWMGRTSGEKTQRPRRRSKRQNTIKNPGPAFTHHPNWEPWSIPPRILADRSGADWVAPGCARHPSEANGPGFVLLGHAVGLTCYFFDAASSQQPLQFLNSWFSAPHDPSSTHCEYEIQHQQTNSACFFSCKQHPWTGYLTPS